MGFEPTIPISRDNGFQDRRIRPLCHLSNTLLAYRQAALDANNRIDNVLKMATETDIDFMLDFETYKKAVI